MRIAIIGAGAVGASCARALLQVRSCTEIVLLDENKKRESGAANDIADGAWLQSEAVVRAGDYEDIAAAAVIVVTAGVNEKTGGAIDPADRYGRLRLLRDNRPIYADIIPKIAERTPSAIIVVVTDPPDALADVARELDSPNQIISSGTYLDSQRFRRQIAHAFDLEPKDVDIDANVIGEHGKSQVHAWSSARIDDEPVLRYAEERGWSPEAFKKEIRSKVEDANIAIIKGTGASQHGIGLVTASIVGALLGDGDLEEPVGLWHDEYEATLSVPTKICKGRAVVETPPVLSAEEAEGLRASADLIREALRIF